MMQTSENLVKVLLDECVTVSFNKYKAVDKRFEHSIKLIGMGAKDDQVMQFAKENGYMVVTQDRGLIARCMVHNVPVAWYRDGKAFVIVVSQTFEIPYQTVGAPIKFKNAKPKPSKIKKALRKFMVYLKH